MLAFAAFHEREQILQLKHPLNPLAFLLSLLKVAIFSRREKSLNFSKSSSNAFISSMSFLFFDKIFDSDQNEKVLKP